MTGQAVCIHCKHKWTAVAEIGTYILDCPECGLGKGLFANLALPQEGEESWQCNCGNGYFIIRKSGCMCVNCGLTQVLPF